VLRIGCLALAFPIILYSQYDIICTPGATSVQIRSEGISEKLATLSLNCQGPPRQSILSSLIISLSSPVTSHLKSLWLDVPVQFNGNSNPVLSQVSTRSANEVYLRYFSVSLSDSGTGSFQFPNIRVVADPNGNESAVTATFKFEPTEIVWKISSPQITVAQPRRSLYASSQSLMIPGVSGQWPANPDFYNLIAAGAIPAAIRATEGSPAVFETKAADATNGIRIMMRFSGAPIGSKIYVPDFLAGSTAATPTSSGEFGLTRSGGVYQSTGHSLLLMRVTGAAEDGSGGNVSLNLSSLSQPINLRTVSSVTIQGGQGYAVWEVVDSNPTLTETVQVPAFFLLPPGAPGG
jgi:hypothetical protein